MRSLRRTFFLIPLLLLAPAITRAAWQPNGNLIGAGTRFIATASGPDRVIVGWLRLVTSDYEVRAQAYTVDGDLVAGWPVDGVLVFRGPSGASVSVVEDGAGGAFVCWSVLDVSKSTVRLQHLSASGSVAAGWPAEGVDLGASFLAALAADGAGGVLVARAQYYAPGPGYSFDYSVNVHRIDATGVPAPGWPAGGLLFPHTYEAGLLVDADRHVFVSTVEFDPATPQALGMVVRRLQENGAPDPAWPANGVLLEDGRYGSRPQLFPDGAGGTFPEWSRLYVCVDICPYIPNQWAARVLGDGTTHGGWIPPRNGYAIAPDGAGGILVGLVNAGRPAAVRLDANGSVMPGWAAEGSPAMTESVRLNEIGVTSDGQGGTYLAWIDSRGGTARLYASRLDVAGRLASGWPSTGSVVSTHAYPFGTGLVTLAGGDAVVVWEESNLSGPPGNSGYLTALRPGEPGPLAELGPVTGDVGFGVVSIRPNPARGPLVATIELPVAGSARLDLVDATGRLVESQDFNFRAQARGAVQFNQGRTLPAGVYWLRLTQGGRVSSRKVALLE